MKVLVSLFAVGTLSLLIGPVQASTTDHLKCYKVRDSIKLRAVVDLDAPPLGFEAGCKVSPGVELCLPALSSIDQALDASQKPPTPLAPSTLSAANAANLYLCYKLKCPGRAADQAATDEFGTRDLTRLRASRYCAPANLGTTTTTTTTVTTLPTQSTAPSTSTTIPACSNSGQPQCDGVCTAGLACAGSFGSCECVPSGGVTCGPQLSGTVGPLRCWGECPVGEVCGDLSGTCGCVSYVPTTSTTTTSTTLPNDSSPGCSESQPYSCDGGCPLGKACVATPSGCACQQDARPCGSIQGAPTCYGTCPLEMPRCAYFDGQCLCVGGAVTTTTCTTMTYTTTTSTTLPYDCGDQGGYCAGNCYGGFCAAVDGSCSCVPFPPTPCAVQLGIGGAYCGGVCPAGYTCANLAVPVPDQCPPFPTCGCAPIP